jgi:hypothetical protein
MKKVISIYTVPMISAHAVVEDVTVRGCRTDSPVWITAIERRRGSQSSEVAAKLTEVDNLGV